ncbi:MULTISPECIES: hypothetical protein [unclassified Enterococcus]|uniref:hypothetical protein n=1 Tax=unclassified Enterococcus TaxID=2608891 RepID=UPI0015567FC5|nr:MULTISPECIES: hypothetical protein [unclassified Enterococcus]MBS7576565.1 hypothetical protein [Enterococcus sp. MMGLQ5-2]MBS7583948.1 hypothetical protein [Enterococcus sp. MMGLQ5-1]NPD11809.1 hypothetical protein [Enterococcus sp. MMGLQ5-1]NPD36402.1 hypothetical protein [Enterococcus sp. MMGLQ5-2]
MIAIVSLSVFILAIGGYFFFTNKSQKDNQAVVYTISDQSYKLADYNFQRYLSRKALFNTTKFLTKDELNQEANGATYEVVLSADVVQGLKTLTAIRQLANQYQVKNDKEQAANRKKTFIKALGGQKAFQKLLTEQNITERAVDEYIEVIVLADILTNQVYLSADGKRAMTPEEKQAAETFYSDNYAKYEYIYFALTDDNGQPIDAQQRQAKEATAQVIIDNEAEKSFAEYIVSDSEDKSEAGQGVSYQLKTTDNVLSETIFELSINQVSELKTFDSGLYIFHRLELDEGALSDYENSLQLEKKSQ